MVLHITNSKAIETVSKRLKISETDLYLLREDEVYFLADSTVVFKEVRRVARYLEAKHKVTISRFTRYFQ